MKTKLFCAALAVLFALAGPAMSIKAFENPFAIRSVLGPSPEQKNALVSVEAGGLLEFSASDLERRLELEKGSLKGITVTSLPDRQYGGLFVDGVEVTNYEFFERSELDKLCFSAAANPGTATIGLLPRGKGAEPVLLNIQVLAQANRPPVLESLSLETAKNVDAYQYLTAWDPDGDPVRLQLISAPKKGEVSISGKTLIYRPWHNKTGSDSFLLCAVDSKGAYSPETTVSVSIGKENQSLVYADMTTHPSQYAALMLHKVGVYTGEKIGNSYFFQPDRIRNRADFLVWLLTAAGMTDSMSPTVNTGLPGDESIPLHYKRYVKKAMEEGIISSSREFAWQEIPTRAECVVLTARAAKIDDVKSYPLTMADAGALPDWSVKSYRDLAAYRMLDLYDGYAHPRAALTNSYAADLCWQLYKHTHR
ncbi:MAG: Ig-like domain-containing protein [Oscillospiraceae bacterium]|jgi:hypothetical protein